MKRKTPTPHDALFRRFLTHAETAREFLEIYLPPALLAVCNLSTLKLESGSFVEDNLKAHISDMLYSLETTKGKGYVYCVVEHQSTENKMMAFRMLRYSVSAMQQHISQGHDTLPLVIPVLFYHGTATPYPYSMNWLECFDLPEQARALYTGDFPLIDLTVMPDSEIMTHRRVALMELVLKHARQRDMLEWLKELVYLLSLDCYTDEQLRTAFHYLVQVGNTSDPERFIRGLAEQAPHHEGILMTLAQQFEQKGRQEGRQEAIQQLVRTMLTNGADHETIMKLTGLSAEELAGIIH